MKKQLNEMSVLSIFLGIVLAVLPYLFISNYKISGKGGIAELIIGIFVNGLVVSIFYFIETWDDFQEKEAKIVLERWKSTILLIFNSIYFSYIVIISVCDKSSSKLFLTAATLLLGISISFLFPHLFSKLLKQEIRLEKERKKLKRLASSK